MQCPYATPLQILSRKWSYFVLRAMPSAKTFGDLKAELKFVTNRMLSLELHKLANDGLITHVSGKYARTTAGNDLIAATEHLAAWSRKYVPCRNCSSQMKCSGCEGYPEVVGLRSPGTKV